MVHLTPADVSDSTGAQAILDAIRKRWPWVKHLFADATYDRLKLMDKAAYLDFVVEIIRRSDGQKGFEVLPRRWVVERTFGWMTRWRRLVRDYEQRIDVSYRRAFALTHLQPVVVRRFELRPNGSGRRRAGITRHDPRRLGRQPHPPKRSSMNFQTGSKILKRGAPAGGRDYAIRMPATNDLQRTYPK